MLRELELQGCDIPARVAKAEWTAAEPVPRKAAESAPRLRADHAVDRNPRADL